MDIRISQLRRRRKACKKMKRKCVTLWKTLGIFLLVLAIVCSVFGGALFMFDNVAAVLLGVRFWDVIDGDARSTYTVEEERLETGGQLCYELTAEGSVLLINENSLPMQERGRVCLLADTETELLEAALTRAGLSVSTVVEESCDAVIVFASDPEELEQGENGLLTASQWKTEGKTGSVILLLSTQDVSKMEFFRDERYTVDACLWIGDAEQYSVDALADILTGKVSPSGSLPETAVYDISAAPAAENLIPAAYSDAEGKREDTYLIYQEGVYVGYLYYETRYEDLVMGTGNPGSYVYGEAVAFPFGHGLSYTAFAYSDMAVSYNGETDRFTVNVTVTNTGTMAGKETVQIYAQTPYTQYDIENKVEKASVKLVGFGKTALLEPGAVETVTVEVDASALAAFDAYGAGTYILDAGDYYLTAAVDAHNAVNNILAAKGYSVENTEGRMDGDGNVSLTYKHVRESFDAETYAVEAALVTKRLSQADPNLYEGTAGHSVTWLSRSDWEGTYPADKISLSLTERLLADLQGRNQPELETVEMPVMGAKNGVKLQEMIGVDYNDPKWEQLLDQLSYGEMVSLIGDGFLWQMPVRSVHAPGAREKSDAWEKLQSLIPQRGSRSTKFPSAKVMAATFNSDMVSRVGEIMGADCLGESVTRLYISGGNIQRVPGTAGLSEDSFLSGMIRAAQVSGVKKTGVIPVLTGFALPDSGVENTGVWLGEQAAREVYLRSYKLSGADSVATDSLRWGTVWSGSNEGLLTGIWQQEWGKQGVVTVGDSAACFGNAGNSIAAGAASFDAVLPDATLELWTYRWNPAMVTAMREACHQNLYTLVNSAAMNGIGPETKIKTHQLPYAVSVGAGALTLWVLFAVVLSLWIRGVKKWKKSEQYLNYRTMKRALKRELRKKT